MILPDGKLLVLGGSEQGSSTPVYIPEIFDPVTETWQSNLPPASIPRVYHSVALLLPDGRVWNAGGNPNNGVTGQKPKSLVLLIFLQGQGQQSQETPQ